MRDFSRRKGVYTARLEEFEVALLESLVQQVVDLISGNLAPESSDPFEQLVGCMGAGPSLDHEDPVIARLFPDAYPDDPSASSDFRRYTESDAVRSRLADAQIVLEDLGATHDGKEPVRIAPDRVTPWIKTLNALRLALSARLGITDDAAYNNLSRLPARDPRSQMVNLYNWIGYVLESLLSALR